MNTPTQQFLILREFKLLWSCRNLKRTHWVHSHATISLLFICCYDTHRDKCWGLKKVHPSIHHPHCTDIQTEEAKLNCCLGTNLIFAVTAKLQRTKNANKFAKTANWCTFARVNWLKQLHSAHTLTFHIQQHVPAGHTG